MKHVRLGGGPIGGANFSVYVVLLFAHRDFRAHTVLDRQTHTHTVLDRHKEISDKHKIIKHKIIVLSIYVTVGQHFYFGKILILF